MARLIVGHTTSTSVRVWVRGARKRSYAYVGIEGAKIARTRRIRLKAETGYTGVVTFRRLEPDREYRCEVTFAERAGTRRKDRIEYALNHGRFRTYPRKGSRRELRFLFGSCNLHSMGLIQAPDRAYETLCDEARREDSAFMLHCGDQIYYDIPRRKSPTVERYRDKYLDAWGDSRWTRRFLTRLPHYMILDDHEIVDNFDNGNEAQRLYKRYGLQAYREFQFSHSPRNHGSGALDYDFSWGPYPFFVADTRSERRRDRNQIISQGQMKLLKNWLRRHREALKFFVTSVPFVVETRRTLDKWNGFRGQREEILGFLLREQIRGLVVLCGDQHHTHHATLELTDGTTRRTIHELMSSPINQIRVRMAEYRDYHKEVERISLDRSFRYRCRLLRSEFFNAHSCAMAVRVQGRSVRYRAFRTRGRARRVLAGSFRA